MDSADFVGSSPFAPATCVVGVDSTRRRFRFCELRWQATPFGCVASVWAWGRLGTAGRSQVREYPDRKAAGPELERAVRLRLQRSYWLVGVR